MPATLALAKGKRSQPVFVCFLFCFVLFDCLCVSVCLSVYLFVCLSACLAGCLPLPACLPFPACLAGCLSVRLFVSLTHSLSLLSLSLFFFSSLLFARRRFRAAPRCLHRLLCHRPADAWLGRGGRFGLSVCLFVRVSLRLSVLFVCLFVCLSVCLSVCLCLGRGGRFCLSVCLFVFLCLSLFVCVCVCACLFIVCMGWVYPGVRYVLTSIKHVRADVSLI